MEFVILHSFHENFVKALGILLGDQRGRCSGMWQLAPVPHRLAPGSPKLQAQWDGVEKELSRLEALEEHRLCFYETRPVPGQFGSCLTWDELCKGQKSSDIGTR